MQLPTAPDRRVMPEPLQLTGPHWSYALTLYKQPGVADACLWLQDHCGVDVNVLLFALFVASSRTTRIDRTDIAALDAVIAQWRNEIIVPLRTIRRRMKRGPPPAPSDETETARSTVKRAELEAEQIELAVLAREFGGDRVTRAGSVDLDVVASAVIEHYVQQSNAAADIAKVGEAQAIIAEAAMRLASAPD